MNNMDAYVNDGRVKDVNNARLKNVNDRCLC